MGHLEREAERVAIATAKAEADRAYAQLCADVAQLNAFSRRRFWDRLKWLFAGK